MHWVLTLMLVACTTTATVNDDTGSDAQTDPAAVPLDSGATDVDTAADGTEDTAEDDTETIDTSSTDPTVVVPAAGSWSTSEFTVVSDPCGLSNFRDPSSFLPPTLVVSNTDGSSFDLGAPSAAANACLLDGADFECERFTSAEDTGVGATLTLDQGLSGDVLSTSSMNGTLDLIATCTGGGCVLLELGGLTFPCTFQGEFDMISD